ncbi:hypothetical protein L195_g052258 [Trifolium pratense]|uniref:Uncharacterized protein n=1 Tax=Trifolium pratense TaxID=57577 RepID=A0A2K3K437_TRIPR|nr:hypothetical protein L195_g052258 [Trifolium pratense]
MRGLYIIPSAGPRPLMDILMPSMSVEKRLESHDEQQMLIIPMSDIVIALSKSYVDQGLAFTGLWLLSPIRRFRGGFLQRLGLKPSP